MSDTIQKLLEERKSQDKQWGGPEHDDSHLPHDWVHFIDKQLMHLDRYAALLRENRDDMAQQIYGDDFCERLVKIGALAIAAIESMERKA